MKIICQTCGQRLPKTAVMCPNCGGRQFMPADSDEATIGQPYQRMDYTNPVVPNHTGAASNEQTTAWQSQPAHIATNQGMPQTPWETATAVTTPSTSSFHEPYNPAYGDTNGYTTPSAADYVTPQQPMTAYPAYPSQSYEPQRYPTSQANSGMLPPTRYDTAKAANTMLYAGFVRRVFAFIFDSILIGLLLAIGYQLALPKLLDQFGWIMPDNQLLVLIAALIYWWYVAFFTSRYRQATIGKIMMGLWVFGMRGQRIGFFHALIRELLKIVLLPLAFIMWFTARKQTLHDLIARTVVLYDPN